MPEIVAVVLAALGAVLGLGLVVLARREAHGLTRRAEAEAEAIRATALQLQAQATEDAQRARNLASETAVAKDAAGIKLLEASEQLRGAEAASRRAEDIEREHGQVLEAELARVGSLSAAAARAELLMRIEAETAAKAVAQIRRVEEATAREAEAKAKSIMATAVQRVAAATSAESVVTMVRLRSEELKGRIIGREGRNIRTFEALTGVNLVVDDSPDMVMLSCFDPARREIAYVALEDLLADGRIHPQRIEAAVADAESGAGARTVAAGYAAAEEAGISGLAPEIIAVLGGLRLRTSFGQNVLAHLTESARIARHVATELGLDAELATRSAFLHDIGKGLGDAVGTHAVAGAQFLADHGEAEAVVNAVASHHQEVEPATVEAIIVQASDAASAARPGARRDEMDQYIERMRRLESMIKEHPAVLRVFAISAGREVRVAVDPGVIDDRASQSLARELAERVERELTYPGQIKIIVIRELKASATAS